MKVSHLGEEHLVCLSSEEVALLVDLCHAAVFSDELGADEGRSASLRRFMEEMQQSLFSTAQSVWKQQRLKTSLTPPGQAGDRPAS
jgi:ATP phosphoribosyltransferase regulatory subunit HisZ